VIDFPLPGLGAATVVVAAPAPGPGNWVGASSAAFDDEDGVVLAYRVRTEAHRGNTIVVAHTADGERATTVAELDKAMFAAESLERPALVRTESGRWRLYVSCATPDSKHWRIDAVEAGTPAGLSVASAVTVWPGDERTAVKDPVIRRDANGWRAWVCCHPLDVPGEEDRMYTRYATSLDGLTWQWGPIVLVGRPGGWDARGTRVTAVLGDGRAAYDGRATKEENFAERTGLAHPMRNDILAADSDAPASTARYLDVLESNSGYRIYYEAPLPDGSHELRTEFIPTLVTVTRTR
jgi:hypothetical protein